MPFRQLACPSGAGPKAGPAGRASCSLSLRSLILCLLCGKIVFSAQWRNRPDYASAISTDRE
jgi:hypothetical protein